MNKYGLNFIFLIGLLYFSSNAIAQLSGQPLLDSLLVELTEAEEDTNKVKLYTALFTQYVRSDRELGNDYLRMGIALAQELDYKKGEADVTGYLGNSHFDMGNSDSALYYLKISKEISETIGATFLMARCEMLLGMVYDYDGEFEKALEHYQNAVLLYKLTGEHYNEANAINNAAKAELNLYQYADALDRFSALQRVSEEYDIPKYLLRSIEGMSRVYRELSNYPKALDYALIARDQYQERKDTAGVSEVEKTIAIIFQSQEYYEKALTHYNISLALDRQLHYTYGVALTLNNIGSVYEIVGDDDKALINYELALEQFGLASDAGGYATAVYNIGTLHKKRKEHKEALANFKNAHGICSEYGDLKILALSLGEMGGVYLNIAVEDSLEILKKFSLKSSRASLKMALTYTDSAVKQLRIIDNLHNLKYYLEQKSKIEAKLGDNENALKSFREYTVLNDSLFNIEKDKKLVQTDLNYTFAKRADELEQQRKQEAAAAKVELDRQRAIRNFSLVGGAGFLLFAIVFFRQRNKVKREKARSDELLLNILPEQVAEELKEKGYADAKLIENVTVLFTDFKGFTALAEKLSAKELVDDLNVCFSAFDRIMEKYGIEKIKTIGDAYMAAGGLPLPDELNAEHAIQAAFEIRDFVEAEKAEKMDAGLPYFEIRIGIHTGPVVAGIVGVKKFQYDIWGDTVNTASRMESSGEVGQVNISQATYELLKNEPYFTFESRGKIEAKGKGEMEMYFVTLKSQEA